MNYSFNFSAFAKRWVAAIGILALAVGSLLTALPAQASDLYTQGFGGGSISGTLNGIVSYNNNDVVVVGDSGTAYLSEDGGDTWTDISPTSNDLVDIDAEDDESMMVMLSDAYETWYTATNGDGAWTAGASIPSAGPTAASDIAVATNSMWYVVGSLGTVYKTSNKGSSWSTQGVGGLYSLNAVDFLTSTRGVIVGNAGMIWTTTDGGTTWTSQTSGTTENLNDVVWISTNTLWAVGNNGTVVQSTNGGTTWTTDAIVFGSPDLYGIQNRGGNRIAITGDSTFYYTDDSGSSWSIYSEISGTDAYYDAAFPTDDSFWAVGEDGSGDMLVSKLDNEAPTITSVALDGGSPDSDATPQLTVVATDNAGTSGLTYHYIANGTLDQSIGSDEESLVTPLTEGTHTLSVVVEDEAGNESDQYDIEYTLDLSAPVVGNVSPISATAGQSTTMTVSTSDTTDIDCDLYINGSDQGAMSGTSTHTKSYTFSVAGNYTAHAVCTDAVGNTTTGSSVTVTVAEASSGGDSGDGDGGSTTPDPEPDTEPETGVSEAEEGSLIKMACDEDRMVNDPCTAVYWYGDDGKRHAFPNEKVYFTWFDDFDDVIVVTEDFMASITLGANVTYHPGTKMVKFLSVNTVYAVEKGGVLRAIDSEETASALYGIDWNTKIDDINDAFFGNYSFGDDIESASDYDVDDAMDSVDDLNDNF